MMTPETLATIVLIVSFILLIAHHIPIAFSIGISTVLSYLCLWPDRPLLIFMQVSKDMWHGIDSYALLAIPMFVFSGLGGAWVPLEVTGETFAKIGHISPIAWAMDGFKNVIIRGFGLDSVLVPAAALAGYAVVFFTLAVWRLSSVDEK